MPLWQMILGLIQSVAKGVWIGFKWTFDWVFDPVGWIVAAFTDY